jgi:antitoxin component of MazEF toxin-antitoxin module
MVLPAALMRQLRLKAGQAMTLETASGRITFGGEAW